MARPKYPSDKQDQFMLRLPAGMRDRLKEAAAAEGRSTNAEIVQRLEDSFAPQRDKDPKVEAAFTRGVVAGVIDALLKQDDPVATMRLYQKNLDAEVEARLTRAAVEKE